MSNISKIEGRCGRCVDVNFEITVVEETRQNCTNHCKDEKQKSKKAVFPVRKKATTEHNTGQNYNDKVDGSGDGVSDCRGK